jgi:uncharacterized protein (DUF2062 family)
MRTSGPEGFPDASTPQVICAVYASGNGRNLPDVIQRILSVHDQVMVIHSGLDGHLEKVLKTLDVVLFALRRPGKGRGVLQAAQAAYRMGKTHMVTLDTERQCDPRDIRPMIAAIRETPRALVIGRRTGDKKGWRFNRANFWLRLQTGTVLSDAGCPLRAYPLEALQHLKIWSKAALFDMEVLVRAAWAGLPFKEVPIVFSRPDSDRAAAAASPWTAVQRVLLNIHLTMRSITPLPHRKIAPAEGGRRGRKISLLHPLRAIRTLLTDNITPKRLAAAAALGVFLGTLPLIALHVVTILFAAGYFRLNKVAALTASQLCMPPIVPALCIETGYFIRHGEFLTEISLRTLGYQALERLWEWLLGSLLLAPLLALLVGGIVYLLALLIQKGILKKNGY